MSHRIERLHLNQDGNMCLFEVGDSVTYTFKASVHKVKEFFINSGDVNTYLHDPENGLGVVQGAMLFGLLGTAVSKAVPSFAIYGKLNLDLIGMVFVGETIHIHVVLIKKGAAKCVVKVCIDDECGDSVLTETTLTLASEAVVERMAEAKKAKLADYRLVTS